MHKMMIVIVRHDATVGHAAKGMQQVGSYKAHLTALGMWSTYCGLMTAFRSSSRIRVK